ncbi:hypothetical protein ACFV1L_23025 [Kitasatospora sp. NPDC059646]|uniref:hypothetical protein n=1 Tax=Kitasatospora sp. NPDC059646 TaxID=3346893 RepID=UPI0036CF95BB
MGYDIHLTRRRYWFDEDGPEIGFDEWRAAVDADPELVVAFYGPAAGGQWWAELPDPDAPYPEGMEWRGARASAKHPSTRLLVRMYAVAQRLGARVQGDDGEYYDERGEQVGYEAH